MTLMRVNILIYVKPMTFPNHSISLEVYIDAASHNSFLSLKDEDIDDTGVWLNG